MLKAPKRFAQRLLLFSITFCKTYTTTTTCQMSNNIVKVTENDLGISEPNPEWFGNRGNIDSPHWTNKNWLKSRFHFNFAEWNEGRSNFGVLRVLNDDLVQPQRGFGTHPHANMEIVTYVVDGELTHKDSMGTSETLTRGAIQFMTAGTGIRHSEHNNHPTLPLRFIQIWIVPRKSHLTPNYGSMIGDKDAELKRTNQLSQLVGDVAAKNEAVPVHINQDVNLYVAELDEKLDEPLKFNIAEGRQAYLIQIEGTQTIADNVELKRHEAALITGPQQLAFNAIDVPRDGKSHFLLIEMKKQ